MDPQQIIFSRLLVSLRARGYTVYDGKIPPTAAYPFFYMADTQTVDTIRKDSHGERIYQDIHIWQNNLDRRGDVSAMIKVAKEEALNIEDDLGYLWRECNVNIMEDDTTAQPLMHAIINLRFDH